jgi:hypothetical protein
MDVAGLGTESGLEPGVERSWSESRSGRDKRTIAGADLRMKTPRQNAVSKA